MDKPLKSVTHGQCDVRPTVTFPAAGYHRPLTGTKLYCLVTEAHVCEQLAQGCYLKVERPGVEPATFVSRANTLTIIPPGHILRQQSFLLMFCAQKIHSNIVKSCFTSKVQSAMHKKARNSSFKVCFVSVCFGTIGLFLQEEGPRTQTSSDHYPSGI